MEKEKKPGKKYPEKEKAAAGEVYIPSGEVLEHGFNRTWGGHRFLDKEIEMLLQGEEIKVMTQIDKIILGKLEKSEFNGKEFWGFQIGIPQKTAGHKWTAEEREMLYEGEGLIVEDFYSPKTCEEFTATAWWNEDTRNIDLEFESEE